MAWSRLASCLLALGLPAVGAIDVKLAEVVSFDVRLAEGEYDNAQSYTIERDYGGVDPIDQDCYAAEGRCKGILTRDGSLELNSRYGCTEPFVEDDDSTDDFTDDGIEPRDSCGVTYTLSEDGVATVAEVAIALHPDSVKKLRVFVDDTVVVEGWEGVDGSEMQVIPGLDGAVGEYLTIQGITEAGDYVGILEVEILLEVEEVGVLGVSASSRASITASATTDASSAINTLDGDTTDSSSWTCSSGDVCELTYDLEDVESLEQIRIAFSSTTDAGGEFSVLAAGASGIFSSLREDLGAGGRPSGSDGLQTFGGIRALSRYVKIVATPASGGIIGINEVEFRVGEDAPYRPVAEKSWLKNTGPLPAGREDTSNYNFPAYDTRAAGDGGCDSPGIFDGCHIIYIKDGDMTEDSRWTCGPLMSSSSNPCRVEFDLNIYRYVRQIQLAFHLGDEQHHEFAIEAYTKEAYSRGGEWTTVVPSAITSGDTTDFQTFNVAVHTNIIRVVPKFRSAAETIDVKEIIILERRKNAFVEGTVPIRNLRTRFDEEDEDIVAPAAKRFKFDIPAAEDYVQLLFPSSTVSALRLRFPASRIFVFEVAYSIRDANSDWVDESERFTSAGGESVLEEFTLLTPVSLDDIEIVAVEGPTFSNKPKYPALRVTDLQLVGELNKEPNTFQMVSTAMTHWGYYQRGRIPDIVAEGSADQKLMMTAICEAKGATFDGIDCDGELDDTAVTIDMPTGEFYVSGPVFLKSGVTLEGSFNAEFTDYTHFIVYDDPNTISSGEDAVIVIDGATDVSVDDIEFTRLVDATGPIVPGTVGNLCLEVTDSTDIRFGDMVFETCLEGAARFTDSSNITAFIFWGGGEKAGNYLELTRVSDFFIGAPPKITGLRLDTCTNTVFQGAYETFEIPDPGLFAPAGGDQTANVVITGDSSGIIFRNMPIGPNTESRIIMESTEPLTLDDIPEYVDAVSGDCIVEVPEGSTEDIIVQMNSEVTLIKSGNCFVLP